MTRTRSYENLNKLAREFKMFSTIDFKFVDKPFKSHRPSRYNIVICTILTSILFTCIVFFLHLLIKPEHFLFDQQLSTRLDLSRRIERTDGCFGTDGRYANLVTIIFSKAASFDARMAIRMTWGRKAMKMGFFYFLLGPSSNVEVLNKLNLEDTTYEDIIQTNATNGDNSNLKTLVMLEWLAEYCDKIDYVLRADDDMLVDIYRLASFLHSHKSLDSRAIIGNIHTRWRLPRWWLWNILTRWITRSTQLDYLIELPYLITGSAIKPLLDSAIVKQSPSIDFNLCNTSVHHSCLISWESNLVSIAKRASINCLLYPTLMRIENLNFSNFNHSSDVTRLLISRGHSPKNLLHNWTARDKEQDQK